MTEDNYQEAIKALEKAANIALAPGGDRTSLLNNFNNLSESYRMLGEIRKAENGMRYCVNDEPKNIGYRRLLIQIYLLEDEILLGLYHANEALALETEAKTEEEKEQLRDCRLFRAVFYLEAGLDDLARKDLDKAAEDYPNWPQEILAQAKGLLDYDPEKRPPAICAMPRRWQP